MARGSKRQRKKIAKRLARLSLHRFGQQVEEAIRQNSIRPVVQSAVRIPAPKEEIPVTKQSATVKPQTKKRKKKLNRKQRKRLKLQQRREQQVQYRGTAQQQYYEENRDKEYTDEVRDMTAEYAQEILDDLNNLADGTQKDILLRIFDKNYQEWGGMYIQTLHDSGFDNEIHNTVELCIANYKGAIPPKYYFQMMSWLNLGLPVDARKFDEEDDEDITSEYYE